jgi:hypothetical protein
VAAGQARGGRDYPCKTARRQRYYLLIFAAIPFSFFFSNLVYVVFGEGVSLFLLHLVGGTFMETSESALTFVGWYYRGRIFSDIFNLNFWVYVVAHPFFIDPKIGWVVPDTYTPIYFESIRLSALLLRPLLTVAFIVSFLVIRPGHKLLSILLYRFAEAESGVLAVLAGIMAGIIKLIQMAVKASAGH